MKLITILSRRWLGLSVGRVTGLSLLLCSHALAAEYHLVVQPIQSPEQTRASYQPLADYLSKATGQQIKLVTARNFVAYWETMKKGDEYDLILDAAHFTDYRIQRMKFKPLAKLKDVVSFALVTHEDNPVLEPMELIGKPIAVLPSPSMGAVRLAQLFPNPLRQPIIVKASDAQDAVDKIKQGKAVGAVIPSPMVGLFPFLYTVQTTKQVPHMALSASPRVPDQVQKDVRDAVLNANKTADGQAMLKALNFEAFEPATAKMYKGYAQLLQGVFGY
jgi:ABC-type phosphate/phosphonate transport system substrate-binding protein